MLSLIAALDNNGVIGAQNKLLWHLPAELAYFKRITMGKPIIMGRKTHESIGKALPGRRNIIISRNPHFIAPDCEVVSDVASALARVQTASEAMVIGGADIYQQTLPKADRLYLTIVHHAFEGDVFFPARRAEDWIEVSREEREKDAKNIYSLSFLVFERANKVEPNASPQKVRSPS